MEAFAFDGTHQVELLQRPGDGDMAKGLDETMRGSPMKSMKYAILMEKKRGGHDDSLDFGMQI